MAAYGDGVQAPFYEGLWTVRDWISTIDAAVHQRATLVLVAYVNRKFHAGSGSFWNWRTDNDPDPDMSETTPTYPKNEYSDHVITQVIEAA